MLLFPKALIDLSFLTICNLATLQDQPKALVASWDKFVCDWACQDKTNQKY